MPSYDTVHPFKYKGRGGGGRRRVGEGESEERGKEMSWRRLRNFTIYEPSLLVYKAEADYRGRSC